jgi:hypothetical protein
LSREARYRKRRMGVLIGLFGLCFLAGLLVLVLGTANALFGWDLWGTGDEHPVVFRGEPFEETGSYGGCIMFPSGVRVGV